MHAQYANLMTTQRAIIRSLTDFLRDYKLTHTDDGQSTDTDDRVERKVTTSREALERVRSSSPDSD